MTLALRDCSEYDYAARWCARRGIVGAHGDPLPEFLSVRVCDAIAEDEDAFRERVREFAYAEKMDRLNLPEGDEPRNPALPPEWGPRYGPHNFADADRRERGAK